LTAIREQRPTFTLRRGSAKPLHSGHPWVFADAIERHDGPRLEAGDEVRVLDHQGQFLGRGYFSPDSAIAVRIFTREDEPCDEALLARRIDAAMALRKDVLGLGEQTSAYRLIYSEGDGLGGLIVDRYGDYLAVQIGTVGIERRKAEICKLLQERLAPKAILDKSDVRTRKLEGLEPPSSEPLAGTMPAEPFEVLEDGIAMRVDLRPGAAQKTGLYVDQRENRRRFAGFARDREVLDVFSYTGAFTLHAARAGAKSLTLVESSEAAMEAAKTNLERNKIDDADLVCADWTEGLRHLREQNRTFSLVVLDPPKFARGKDAVAQALSGYRDLNAQAARLIAPGGLLFTCSCSGNVSETEFERAVASGLAHAGRRAAVLERRGAGPDHPVPPGFDQGRYLKCLVLRVD
jgi:23S rRNA (cytosine1962-C5)-methyltransferase